MTPEDLKAVLQGHAKWCTGAGGTCANLSGAYLSYADLSYTNLRGAYLSYADLRYANLRGTSLSYADLIGTYLSCADLSDVYLSGAVGNMHEIRSLQLSTWPVTYTSTDMAIGCEQHPIADWWDFDDDTIAAMDKKALDWWRRWKPTLHKIVTELAPATPTGMERE